MLSARRWAASSLFGLVSYLLKEHYSLSVALISLLAGVIFYHPAFNWIRPFDYTLGSQEELGTITLYFTHLVLDVQLVLASVQLPSKYLRYEWRSLALLLGPGMSAMWLSSNQLVWVLVHSLVVEPCVTPTDRVLSNSIVKKRLLTRMFLRTCRGSSWQNPVSYLSFALYLIKYVESGSERQLGGASKAMGY